jgi:hypothetical protein
VARVDEDRALAVLTARRKALAGAPGEGGDWELDGAGAVDGLERGRPGCCRRGPSGRWAAKGAVDQEEDGQQDEQDQPDPPEAARTGMPSTIG